MPNSWTNAWICSLPGIGSDHAHVQCPSLCFTAAGDFGHLHRCGRGHLDHLAISQAYAKLPLAKGRGGHRDGARSTKEWVGTIQRPIAASQKGALTLRVFNNLGKLVPTSAGLVLVSESWSGRPFFSTLPTGSTLCLITWSFEHGLPRGGECLVAWCLHMGRVKIARSISTSMQTTLFGVHDALRSWGRPRKMWLARVIVGG